MMKSIKQDDMPICDYYEGQYLLFVGDKNTVVINKIVKEGKIVYIHSTNLTGLKKGLTFSASVSDWNKWAGFGRVINHPFLNT